MGVLYALFKVMCGELDRAVRIAVHYSEHVIQSYIMSITAFVDC